MAGLEKNTRLVLVLGKPEGLDMFKVYDNPNVKMTLKPKTFCKKLIFEEKIFNGKNVETLTTFLVTFNV